MIILETIQLGKKFPGSRDWAVQDFDLQVSKGEIVGLIGESGCGKTTILRMIAGFEEPSHGEIRINGELAWGNGIATEPQNRKVGIVFQDYALFPHKTVWENICFGLFRYTRNEIMEKARKIIEICALTGLEQRYPHQLSGGQKQRVALARAMAPEPGLILFDEPFSNIDSVRKNQMRHDIHEIITKTGATAIFVTHDTKDVLAMADKVSVLQKGITLQTGTPAEIYTHPVNTYVTEFFGKANIIKARITENGYLTPVGFLKSSYALTDSDDEVLISIRPEDFELTEETHDCLCGNIIKERFFGDYKEITCLVTSDEGEETELVIHASPHSECENNKCYFKPRSEKLNILRREE